MTIIQVVLLGITEGITEFLPISSTAHLDIVRMLLSIPATDFIKSFEIAIQLGAILAVVALYWNRALGSWKLMRNVIIAFIPTGIIGFALYTLIKSFLLGNIAVEIIALFVGGAIIVVYEYKTKKTAGDAALRTIESLRVRELLLLGVAQSIAVIPGVSRSGAVIIAGRAMQLPKSLITEFSFLLAIPTILAATGYDLLKSGFAFDGREWQLLGVGFLAALVTAYFVVRWLIVYIQNHSFAVFGWYRIVLAALLLLYLIR